MKARTLRTTLPILSKERLRHGQKKQKKEKE